MFWQGDEEGKLKSQEEGLGSIFELVREATSELVGDLSNAEVRSIRMALQDRRRLNRIFDLAGIEYPDWPREALVLRMVAQ